MASVLRPLVFLDFDNTLYNGYYYEPPGVSLSESTKDILRDISTRASLNIISLSELDLRDYLSRQGLEGVFDHIITRESLSKIPPEKSVKKGRDRDAINRGLRKAQTVKTLADKSQQIFFLDDTSANTDAVAELADEDYDVTSILFDSRRTTIDEALTSINENLKRGRSLSPAFSTFDMSTPPRAKKPYDSAVPEQPPLIRSQMIRNILNSLFNQ